MPSFQSYKVRSGIVIEICGVRVEFKLKVYCNQNVGVACVKIYSKVLFHSDTMWEVIAQKLSVLFNVDHTLAGILLSIKYGIVFEKLELWQWQDFCSGKRLGPAGNSEGA